MKLHNQVLVALIHFYTNLLRREVLPVNHPIGLCEPKHLDTPAKDILAVESLCVRTIGQLANRVFD